MASIFRWEEQERSSQFLNDGFQQRLAAWNRRRLAPGFPSDNWQSQMDEDHRMQRLEGAFLEELRGEIAARAAQAPTDVDGFLAWFEDLQVTGPGQGDPLFPWLAREASVDEFKYYLGQEAAGEAGFDDLTAMTQVKVPPDAKMELANNYWDEMGRGNPKGMHGPMLDALIRELGLKAEIADTVWESLALANAMTAMAANRRYAFHSIGALGAIELTAPGRSRAVADGLKRLGFDGKARRYFELHAVLDVRHSEDWNEKVLRPLVAEEPNCATAIAEGALIRLQAGARCFERYRQVMWG
ncbi:iron-containing redox enzyme family protein [Sphingosinicella sp. YJ22]|uniref:iron-containing redox enzyme family protein n=1 Tax=Sphingosinicella sp. YJ22 TaxID=1104780 RepID=UPI00140B370F|nr:iron-containing redox enzyme family protein [Sphingosinicella sp. YJ22]